MSKVIGFRLDEGNPREAQALEILRIKQAEGFSSRKILTDALIGLATHKGQSALFPIDEFNEVLEQVSGLLESLNRGYQNKNLPRHPQAAALDENFLCSEKIAARPGMNIG